MCPLSLRQNPADPEPDAPLARWPAERLRELIRQRVSRSMAAGAVEDDWRLGAVPADVRVELRRYFPQAPTRAAVLVPIVDRGDSLTVLLTERASDLRHHAGQISFPGGRIEPEDASVVEAALREAREEIGLARERVDIIGFLPDHLIVSGFRVTPVVGFVAADYALQLDRREVADAFEVPLPFLLDPANHVRRRRRFENHEVELTDLPWGARNIWGATAGMLLTLYRVLRGEDG
jgi:8-oxo-dGTP pyrophosphatase MutT (NUDIX family)